MSYMLPRDVYHCQIWLQTWTSIINSHVEYQAQQLAKHDSNVHLVLGQLINSKYLDDVADQLNEKLQVVGTLSISTLAKDYNLPSEFLSEEIIKRLGKFIEGFQDEHDPKVILTPAYISRYRARIRGVLTGIQINFLFVANVVFQCYHFSKQFLSNLSKIKYLAFSITLCFVVSLAKMVTLTNNIVHKKSDQYTQIWSQIMHANYICIL